MGSLFSSKDIFDGTVPLLTGYFGPALLESPLLPWDHSTYYRDELGAPIYRKFMFFGRIIDASTLPDIKILTDSLESLNMSDGKRRINLDPGYLTEAKVILATTKNYSHRIYLGRGIYAEQEYIFSKGSYLPLSHAYHDYRKPEYLGLFMQARTLFRQLVSQDIPEN